LIRASGSAILESNPATILPALRCDPL